MEGFIRFFTTLGLGRVLAMVAVIVGLLGFFFFVSTRLTEPRMSLLYGELELDQASQVITRLEGLNINYQLQNNGTAIFVPADQVTTLRVSLAGEGFGGSIIGYELFDRTDSLGTTSFVQKINRVRAIEGELARTIKEINAVNSARVHIVIPERQLFASQKSRSSASVILRTVSGGLSQSQVQAIRYLVATAVPDLDPDNISIVDQRGVLLARGGGDPGSEASITLNLNERQLAYENRLRNQIESLLSKTVGFEHIRAQVSVEMNLSRMTRNSEIFDPDGQVVRSSSTVEETVQNRDPQSAQPVGVAQNLPGAQPAVPAAPTAATSSTSRIEETTNFEISKTTTLEVVEGGAIERISVAVLVDGTYAVDADGVSTYQPRSQAELDQFNALVSSTIGFDAARGDTVEIVNMRFEVIPEPAPIVPPFNLFGLTKEDLKNLIELIVLGVVSILVLILLVKPLVGGLVSAIPKALPALKELPGPEEGMAQIAGPVQQPAITAELAAAAAGGDQDAILAIQQLQAGPEAAGQISIDTQIDVAQVEGRVQDSALKKVGDIVARHPEESTAIVRSWLYSD